jgi:NADH-quinone oxidoreductase subunit N
LYGLSGHLDFASLQAVLAPENILALTGALCLLVALAFKFGSVPFHMWLPDVYQASGARLTLFLATTSKIAAFVLAYRILVGIFPNFPYAHWVCLTLAVTSLLVGNCVALLQTQIKRLLAYSTIGQMGFVFLAFGVDASLGMATAFFYVLTYVLASLAAFGVLLTLTRDGHEIASIEDLRGLSEAHPKLAFVLLLAVLSMAGIPPTVGFTAKLFVFQALMLQGYLPLVVFALIASVVAAYYYLKVIKVMYFESLGESGEEALCRAGDAPRALVLYITAGAILALGLFPGWVYPYCVEMLK